MTQTASPAEISSQYLDEIQTNIRVRPIPWEGYVRANLLSTNEASLMKSIEKQSRDKRAEVVAKQPDVYASTVVDILERITRDDVVKYILSLAGDFAIDVPEFAQHLLDHDQTFETLAKMLSRNDEQIYLLSAKTLVILLSIKTGPPQVATSLFKFLATKLASSPNSNLQDIAVQGFGIMLRSKSYRAPFWNLGDEVLKPLLEILDTTSGTNGVQLQYYTLLVFWLLTFEKRPAVESITKYDLIPMLLNILKNAVKEKIVRLAISTVVNMVNLAPKTSIPALISHSALPFIKTLSQRKWTDEELVEDVEFLQTTLQEAFDDMTTFDEYKHEVMSKKLCWSPPHKSESFWRENSHKFREGDWQVLKELSKLVESEDPVTLAVACYDINRVINELPESLKVLQQNNTKIKVMELMKHSDAEVRYEALKATQSFLAHAFKA